MPAEAANKALSIIFFICYAYQIVYLFLPFFRKLINRGRECPTGADRDFKNRYAVLISARNEENVVGELIECLKNQTYPEELIGIFVCADNCTDKTAETAEEAGAMVYVRNDPERIGKGYALNFMLGKISEGFGRDAFDGFFVFDADNLLEPDYIEETDRVFRGGADIVTGYRGSKNYGDSWISAGYSLWFLRESQFLNLPRYLLGTSCAVSGTGFMFSKEVLERLGGWRYFLLTEDIEFTVDAVSSGEKIAYCERAVLYDEQPTDLKTSVRQRLRWAKGYYQVFGAYGGKLLKGIFSKNFFSCFDMAMAIMPAMILSIAGIVLNAAAMIKCINTPEIWALAGSLGLSALRGYLTFLGIGCAALISEWRKISATPAKKIFYLMLFPAFMLTYIPISIAAIFVKVEWKQIKHGRNL